MNSIISRTGRTAWSAATAALLAAPAAGAVQWDVADGTLKLVSTVTYGAMWRTQAQDTALLFNPNAQLRGLTGTQIGGKNGDDGNLNFDQGDIVSMPVKGYFTLDYHRGGFGLLASAKAWYDLKLADYHAPWGNLPNGLTPGAELGSGGAQRRAEFSGIVGDNAYVYGATSIDAMPVDFKAGYQKLDWGNRFIVLGGLRDLNALDFPGIFRPGAIPVDETRVAAPMVFAGIAPAPDWRIEGFWQVHWQRNIPHQCGTFISSADWLAEGCDKVLTGAANDRVGLATGNFYQRVDTIKADGLDQGGAAIKFNHAPWATEFGLYAARFHSRASYWSVIKSGRTTGAPFIPGDPGGLNPKYFTEFPEAIHMVALTFDTKWRGGGALGELSYRPNQPLQYNAGDAIAAGSSNTAPTPLRGLYSQVAPGGVFTAYERHKNVQLQLGAQQAFPNLIGAQALQIGGEFVYKGVPDLPDVQVIRFGRSDAFGNGPVKVNGTSVCPANRPSACTFDGYVTKHAYGLRARAGLRYADVIDGVDLLPSVTYGWDISGTSGDSGILEGRQLASLALRANFRGGLWAEISYWPTWGGTYNTQRDRDFAQAYVAYRF
jgi:hypothetical protein